MPLAKAAPPRLKIAQTHYITLSLGPKALTHESWSLRVTQSAYLQYTVAVVKNMEDDAVDVTGLVENLSLRVQVHKPNHSYDSQSRDHR